MTEDLTEKRIQRMRRDYGRLRLCDRPRILPELKTLQALPKERVTGEMLDRLSFRIGKALQHSLYDTASQLKWTFPEELPITVRKKDIVSALREHNVIIVCGSTGSGKTTQLPKMALELGLGRYGQIGCTQPRRIAASALARRVAGELNCDCGEAVGYKVRFDDHTGPHTVIKFMTDGILLAETRDDPRLLKYDCLILDEVHERSLNIDFLLGYLKLLAQKRHNLKVIISSATLEAERFSAFFDGAPVIEVEGRLFPVEDLYLPPGEDEMLTENIVRAVEELNSIDPHGDTLIFLPGEREIRDCAAMLTGRSYANTEILPLFGRLSGGDQQKVFMTSGKRRIVLATNVAETSLTIPGIRFVIDSGLVRLSRYNPRTHIQELRVEEISQASARQRRGRCGRLRNGICVHLESEEDMAKAILFTPPEIQRTSLAGVILQMASLHLPPLGEFPLIDEPATALIKEGYRTLEDIGAIAGKDRHVTRIGMQLAAMPVDPHLGKMLLEAHKHRVLPEMLVIVSFLSIQDPRERPFEKAAEADAAHKQFDCKDSDFIGILNLWKALQKDGSTNQALRKFAKKNFLNFRRVREWRSLEDDLRSVCESENMNCDPDFDLKKLNPDFIHQSVMAGLPRQLAVYDRQESCYSDMNGKKFVLFPGSGVARRKKVPEWIYSFTLMETTRVFARCNAEVQPQWLESIAPHLCKSVYDNAHWDPKTGFVYAREKVTCGALLIHPGRRRHYGPVNPAEAREIFIREGLLTGEANLSGTWLEEHARFLRGKLSLSLKMRRPDSLVDTEMLFQWFNEHLPPEINSVDAVAKDWKAHRKSYIPPTEIYLNPAWADVKESDYPDFIHSAGQRFQLVYRYEPGEDHDGITLYAPEYSLPVMDPWVLDYLVPGLLVQKVGVMLRSLPKSKRVPLMPLAETAEHFISACLEKTVFTEQPLSAALAEFLQDQYESTVETEDFENIDFPEYLVMKLAVINDRGCISKILREFPRNLKTNSGLSAGLPAARKWTFSGCRSWPDLNRTMPETVTVSRESETVAFPALTADEENGTIGQALFLKQDEAMASHQKGITALYRLVQPVLIKHLKNQLRIPGKMELGLFLDYRSWKEDLVNTVIRDALGGDLWQIRSSAAFETAVEKSRDIAAGLLLDSLSRLERISEKYEALLDSMRGLQRGGETEQSVQDHLDLLFRPGFLKTDFAVKHYEHYLKGLAIRIDRAKTSPGKDMTKGAELEPYRAKLKMCLEQLPDFSFNESLRHFFLLLEEAEINRYAPEQPTLMKCGRDALAKAWDEVRI